MRQTITYFEEGLDKSLKIGQKNLTLVLLLFIYTTFNGVLRKWIFVGNSSVNNILFLIQLISPYVFYFFYKKNIKLPRWNHIINLYTLILILLALNPLNHTYYHGAFGVIIHLSFWLMMYLYIQDKSILPLERLINFFIIISLIEFILGYIQFYLPANHFLNRYDRNDGGIIALVGNYVRVTGTFTYLGGYSSFIFFYGSLLWYLIVQKKKSLPILIILAIMGLLASFINGSRSCVAIYLLMILCAILSLKQAKDVIYLTLVIGLLTLFAYTYQVFDKVDILNNSYGAFSSRVQDGQSTGESNKRVLGPFDAVINYKDDYALFGMGLGSTYQGANGLWGTSWYVLHHGGFEEEPERIVMEGGFFLLFIRLAMFGLLIKSLDTPIKYSLAVVFFLFFFTIFTFNINQVIYSFFSFCFIDKAYRRLDS